VAGRASAEGIAPELTKLGRIAGRSRGFVLNNGSQIMKHTHRKRDDAGTEAFKQALYGGDPQQVKALLDQGADIHHCDANGYEALVHAVHGRDVLRDTRLIALLRLLIERGAHLDAVTSYAESGLRVLSRLGRFDAVKVLLDAGADESQLAWTPLIKSTALGTTEEMRRLLADGAAIDERDWWSRSAWLVSLQMGDIAKAELLREHGADIHAVGRCAQPPLFYAIVCYRTTMLRWLCDQGFDIEQTDQFGTTALIQAAECGAIEAVDLLLRAGASIDRIHNGSTALGSATSRDLVLRLLGAGADPQHLSQEGRRALVRLPREADASLLDGVAAADFIAARTRRFGAHNAQPMNEPFWLGMVRAGVTGYQANERFNGPSSFDNPPVWCAQRFGQSITLLPDGRIVQIAGEHEDSYDPDFCIYNDVFVHGVDGSVEIYGYPQEVFAPTDFHTATLCGDAIFIVGSLGYWGQREYGHTPVHRLDTRSWRIERLAIEGPEPGWIHGHRAVLHSAHEIRISGGLVLSMSDGKEEQVENARTWLLDLRCLAWREAADSAAA
jgi:ankyrin repeat protein